MFWKLTDKSLVGIIALVSIVLEMTYDVAELRLWLTIMAFVALSRSSRISIT